MLVSNTAGGSINQYSLLKEQFARFSKNFKFIIPSLGLCLRNHSRGVQKQMRKGGNGSIFFFPVQFSSVQSLSRVRLCNPMNRTMPGLPLHHQLPEFTQTHVHQVGDAIQLSHPLSSPFPPAPNPSQQQSLFQWVNSSHEGFFFFLRTTKKVSNNLDFYKSQVN